MGSGRYAELLPFLDLFGIWGKHTLHITVPRIKEPEPEVPLPLPPRAEAPQKLIFGQPLPKETKRIKPLKQYAARPSLY
jgi:hypothetical protein